MLSEGSFTKVEEYLMLHLKSDPKKVCVHLLGISIALASPMRLNANWSLPRIKGQNTLNSTEIHTKRNPRESPSKKQKKPWSLNLSYGVSTNLSDEAQPRSYRNFLGVSTDYHFKNADVLVNGGTGISYTTQNSEVVKSSGEVQETNPTQITSIDLGISKSFGSRKAKKKPSSSHWKPGLSSRLHFPLSTPAQLEGYKAIASLGASLGRDFTSWYSFSNSLGFTYIFNEYSHSLSTNGRPNPSSRFSYRITNTFAPSESHSIDIGVGVAYTQNVIPSENTSLAYNSSISWTYNSRISPSLFYSYGGSTGPNSSEFWWLDSNDHRVGGLLSYEF